MECISLIHRHRCLNIDISGDKLLTLHVCCLHKQGSEEATVLAQTIDYELKQENRYLSFAHLQTGDVLRIRFSDCQADRPARVTDCPDAKRTETQSPLEKFLAFENYLKERDWL